MTEDGINYNKMELKVKINKIEVALHIFFGKTTLRLRMNLCFYRNIIQKQ